MRAISSFNLESGTSTFWWRALIALRTRVRKSATGSVKLMLCFSSYRRPFAFVSGSPVMRSARIRVGERTSRDVLSSAFQCDRAAPGPLSVPFHLPRALRNSRNFSLERQTAEAQTADAELAQIGPRTSANLAAVLGARGELGFLVRLGNFACCSHLVLCL